MHSIQRAQSTLSTIAVVALSSILLCSSAFAEFKRPRISNTDPYSSSVILKSGKYHTLIPKNGILHLPERHKNRIGNDSSGSYLPLHKFIAKNYAWLGTFEVSLDTARGRKPLTEAQLKRIREQGKIIVAVHKKNLVNVTPQKSSTTD